jgi:two-component system chemotaxis response regulator CheB
MLPGGIVVQVLIVDDSAVSREAFAQIFSSDPSIKVMEKISRGSDATEYLQRRKKLKQSLPDVIIMDIIMPGMDGFETTREIMGTIPVPIIITSSTLDKNTAEKTFLAMNAGAVAVVQKPPSPIHPEYQKKRIELIRLVTTMSSVPVIRRWIRSHSTISTSTTAPSQQPKNIVAENREAMYIEDHRELRIVAIGASTGGPSVIQTILAGLPNPFPVPILIVQHISSGFVSAMAEWMSNITHYPVSVAIDGEHPLSGHAYLAPDDRHLIVSKEGQITLVDEPSINGQKPSVGRLFSSIAQHYGRTAIGILLTGMGQDGSRELKLMRDSGALTIAQDRDSSVVYGMPGMAEKLYAADYFLPPTEIVTLLRSVGMRSDSKKRNEL